MTDMSLSNLYRRLTSVDAPKLDADDLADAAAGTLAGERRDQVSQAIAASPARASLVRMLRELRAESETLAGDVARTQRDTSHRRHERSDRRIAATRRHGVLRWATALAACLVAVVGVWTLHNGQGAGATHATSKHVVADEIFSSNDTIFKVGMESRAQNAKRADGDHLFRSNFNNGG
jgi:anti-sigma factor RsiW